MLSPCVAGLALIVMVATACAGGTSSPPTVLSDGSAARPPPVPLEGIDGPSILTTARLLRPNSVERLRRAANCIDGAGFVATAGVERVGASGVSVTLLGPRGRVIYGCDASAESDGSPWCGHAFGRLRAGRIRDPRLSLTCRDHEGEALGFAWIQPAAAGSYVVVARRRYDEVYPVAGGLPVRVTTDDVDLAAAGARFSVSEHVRDGGRVRTYALEARVSG